MLVVKSYKWKGKCVRSFRLGTKINTVVARFLRWETSDGNDTVLMESYRSENYDDLEALVSGMISKSVTM